MTERHSCAPTSRVSSMLPRMSTVGYYVSFSLLLYCELIFNSEPNKNNIIQHYQQLMLYVAQRQHAAGSVA